MCLSFDTLLLISRVWALLGTDAGHSGFDITVFADVELLDGMFQFDDSTATLSLRSIALFVSSTHAHTVKLQTDTTGCVSRSGAARVQPPAGGEEHGKTPEQQGKKSRHV